MRTILEMTVGHSGERELNPTTELTLMPNISKALKLMLLPSTGAWILKFI